MSNFQWFQGLKCCNKFKDLSDLCDRTAPSGLLSEFQQHVEQSLNSLIEMIMTWGQWSGYINGHVSCKASLSNCSGILVAARLLLGVSQCQMCVVFCDSVLNYNERTRLIYFT